MIIARSFARIHETNLKVRAFFAFATRSCVEGTLSFTEAGSPTLMVR
jgi:aconitase A